jgi:hypothetical protein
VAGIFQPRKMEQILTYRGYFTSLCSSWAAGVHCDLSWVSTAPFHKSVAIRSNFSQALSNEPQVPDSGEKACQAQVLVLAHRR